MKRVMLIVGMLVSFVVSADDTVCKDIGMISAGVMVLRQSGQSVDKVLGGIEGRKESIISNLVSGGLDQDIALYMYNLTRKIVVNAYQVPLYKDEVAQTRSVEAFSGMVESMCTRGNS